MSHLKCSATANNAYIECVFASAQITYQLANNNKLTRNSIARKLPHKKRNAPTNLLNDFRISAGSSAHRRQVNEPGNHLNFSADFVHADPKSRKLFPILFHNNVCGPSFSLLPKPVLHYVLH